MSKGAPLTANQKVVVWARGEARARRSAPGSAGISVSKHTSRPAPTRRTISALSGADTDYVWGDPISNLGKVEPGDILQIRDHLVTTDIKIE